MIQASFSGELIGTDAFEQKGFLITKRNFYKKLIRYHRCLPLSLADYLQILLTADNVLPALGKSGRIKAYLGKKLHQIRQ